MLTYKLIETILFDKLSSMDLVNYIFLYISPNNKKKLKIKKQLHQELFFNTIETIFLDKHCDKCNSKSSKFTLVNNPIYLENNKKIHQLDVNNHQTILSFMEKY